MYLRSGRKVSEHDPRVRVAKAEAPKAPPQVPSSASRSGQKWCSVDASDGREGGDQNSVRRLTVAGRKSGWKEGRSAKRTGATGAEPTNRAITSNFLDSDGPPSLAGFTGPGKMVICGVRGT